VGARPPRSALRTSPLGARTLRVAAGLLLTAGLIGGSDAGFRDDPAA
jgi:hypothetical protein